MASNAQCGHAARWPPETATGRSTRPSSVAPCAASRLPSRRVQGRAGNRVRPRPDPDRRGPQALGVLGFGAGFALGRLLGLLDLGRRRRGGLRAGLGGRLLRGGRRRARRLGRLGGDLRARQAPVDLRPVAGAALALPDLVGAFADVVFEFRDHRFSEKSAVGPVRRAPVQCRIRAGIAIAGCGSFPAGAGQAAAACYRSLPRGGPERTA